MNSSSPPSSSESILSNQEETIAAISTPFGESGIGIVRISGSLAEPIGRKLFKSKKAKKYFNFNHLYYGEIIDPHSGKPVDEVLIVLMKSPKTYTKEDILEINCHGGYFILQRVLELVLKEGARMALPGEFTKRAFLNGRIDLTQAEAVIDLIRAKTEKNLDIANQQLRGWFFGDLQNLKTNIVEDLAIIEAHIDFPEEEIDSLAVGEMKMQLERNINKIGEWIESYTEGKIFREGVMCAIIGKTNVGKSSLLNVLLEEERAIVTPIPGTTRDVIIEVMNIHGIPVRLMDTAGIGKPSDFIEQEGIRRTKERVAGSDFIVLMVDGSRNLDKVDSEIFEEAGKKKKVVVINKKDLPLKISLDEIKKIFPKDPVILISALKNEGIDELKKSIYSSLIKGDVTTTPEHLIIANIRHKTILEKVRENLSKALMGLEEGISPEFIAFEIRTAIDALGEIVGETTTDEVLDRIFEQFCIGK